MTGSSSSTDRNFSLPAATAAGIGVVSAAVAFAPGEVFIAFLALVTFGLARESAERLSKDQYYPVWFIAVATAAFPVVSGIRGLASLTVLGALVVMTLGLRFMVSKREKGTVVAIGKSLFLIFFVGLGVGFFVAVRLALVEGSDRGRGLLLGLIAAIMLFRGASFAGARFGGFSGDLSPWLLGIPAAVVGLLTLSLLIEAPPEMWALAAVGVVVGVAAALGRWAMRIVIDPSAQGGVLAHLGAALLASPTYFLGLRFFLL